MCIEFIASGSQKYEQTVKHGLIRPAEHNIQIDKENVDEYLKKLAKQMKKDRLLFTQRMQKIQQALPKLKK